MSDKNKTYYFTFMGKQPLKDHFVRIDAPAFELAREAMFRQFGDKWAMQYTADIIKKDFFPHGCVLHLCIDAEEQITLIAVGREEGEALS